MTIGNLLEPDVPMPLAAEVQTRVSEIMGHQRFGCFRVNGVQSLNNDVRLLVREDGQRFALRLANTRGRMHLGVDPIEEGAIARLAGAAGVGPDVLCADADGLMVTQWLTTARTLAADGFRDPLRRRAVIDLARRLNGLDLSTGPVAGRSIFQRIAALETSANPVAGASMPDRHRAKLAQLAAGATPPGGLTHHDLWPNNILDDGDRLWLIDWEFSGIGDGVYDLACIAISAGLGPAEERDMLTQADRPRGEYDWLQQMKWVVRYFEASWGLVMAGLRVSATDGTGGAFDYGGHATRMIALLDS